jgi:xanthine dehydrogenase accessory factor
MATVVWRQPPSSGQYGSRAIVTVDGEIFGWIGGACAEPVIIREAKRIIEEGTPRLLWLGQEADFQGMHVPLGVATVPMSCQSEGALQIYVEPMQAAPKVLIVGRSPMALTLKELTQAMDWRVQLVSSEDFATSQIDSSTIVIIATQGHGDEEALEIALTAEPFYVGLVASRKRGEVVMDFMKDRGISDEKLNRVKVPIGIDLGHTSHREIAVSILAELVQLRASGELTPAAIVTKPAVEEVTDLVCGMTVEAVPANRPFEFEGVTYYFCAPGCRKVFEKDPSSFLTRRPYADLPIV